jgi:hypothetical protein
LKTTDTELNAIAAPAKIGEKQQAERRVQRSGRHVLEPCARLNAPPPRRGPFI